MKRLLSIWSVPIVCAGIGNWLLDGHGLSFWRRDAIAVCFGLAGIWYVCTRVYIDGDPFKESHD